MRPKALIAWSSGKDSAWALHETRRAGDYEVVGALTTVTETFTPLFPLWMRPTAALAHEMIDAGVETYLVCVDPKQLSKGFAGRRLDRALLAEFPATVDPCGEKGEFHSFVAAGPMLRGRIPVVVGGTVERDGFAYADIMLDGNRNAAAPV